MYHSSVLATSTTVHTGNRGTTGSNQGETAHSDIDRRRGRMDDSMLNVHDDVIAEAIEKIRAESDVVLDTTKLEDLRRFTDRMRAIKTPVTAPQELLKLQQELPPVNSILGKGTYLSVYFCCRVIRSTSVMCNLLLPMPPKAIL